MLVMLLCCFRNSQMSRVLFNENLCIPHILDCLVKAARCIISKLVKYFVTSAKKNLFYFCLAICLEEGKSRVKIKVEIGWPCYKRRRKME